MKRFVLLDTTPIPDNGGALCLFEYGEDFVIKIQGGDGGQLMNTRMHGSEDALAEIPCRKVAGRADSRVLIGGLGMGFTLASALKHLGKTAEVVVAELVPGVVEWNRGPLGEKSGRRTAGPAPTGGNPAPMVDHQPGIPVPAAQVQDCHLSGNTS